MSDENQDDRPITRDQMKRALREIRDEAHYDYILSSERASERAADREDFCEKLAKRLGVPLEPFKDEY